MLFIRSFKCDMPETDRLGKWLKEVAAAIETISYNRLHIIAHEAFVNACKFSENMEGQVIVMIRKTHKVEIIITDPGQGFVLPDSLSPFDLRAIGIQWQLVAHNNATVYAEVDEPFRLKFQLNKNLLDQPLEIKENHRGIISILQSSKELYYHYVPNSFNYFRITC